MAFGATNEPGTCLWCGRKVRMAGVKSDRPHYPNGPYFDTKDCGLAFATRMAELGKRFNPIKPQEAKEAVAG